MPQWKDTDVNFRGSSMAMGDVTQATTSGANILSKLNQDIEAKKRYEAELAQRQAERAQDIDFRNKDFLMRQAVADRDTQKWNQEQLANQRLQGMQSDLSAGLQHGLLTQGQQKDIENRLGQFSEADIASGKAADTMTKQFGNILQAPKTTQEKLSLIRGYQTTGDGYDPSKLIALQAQMAKPYEDQLSREADQAFRLKLSDREQAAANARLNRQLADKPISLYKVDASGNIVYTQARNNSELKALTEKGGWNLGGNIDRAPTSKTEAPPPLFSASKESATLNMDFFGSGDTDQARLLGQRLQNTYKLKPEQVSSILTQATGGVINKSIDPDKLARALINAGAAKTETGANNIAKTLLLEPKK